MISKHTLENDSDDPRNANNTLDFQHAMFNISKHHMLGVHGLTYENLLTKEIRVADYRREKFIYFMDDDSAYDANDWQKARDDK